MRVIIARTDAFTADHGQWVEAVMTAVSDALLGRPIESRFQVANSSDRPLGVCVDVDGIAVLEGPRS